MVNQLIYYNYLMIFTNIDLKIVINVLFELILHLIRKFLLFVVVLYLGFCLENGYLLYGCLCKMGISLFYLFLVIVIDILL